MTIKTVLQTTEQYGTSTERSAMRTSDIADGHRIVFRETDTGAVYEYFGTDWEQVVTNGAAHSFETGLLAGENHEDSATTGYLAVGGKRNATIIGQTTAVTIGGGVANDAQLHGFRVTANFTGNLVIAGYADNSGTATSITFTTPTAGWYDMGDIINSAGALTVTASNAADDNLCIIVWRTN